MSTNKFVEYISVDPDTTNPSKTFWNATFLYDDLKRSIDEIMENEELDNIIVLNDEQGNEVKFEFLDLVELDEEEYVVLLPVSEEGEDDENLPKDKFLCNKPKLQKIIVLIAGVTMNFITAIVILFITFAIWGTTNNDSYVHTIEKGSPAEEAGIENAITFEFSHFMSPNSIYAGAHGLFDRYCEYAGLPVTEIITSPGRRSPCNPMARAGVPEMMEALAKPASQPKLCANSLSQRSLPSSL